MNKPDNEKHTTGIKKEVPAREIITVNIIDYLIKRAAYPGCSVNHDDWINSILTSVNNEKWEDELYMIIPEIPFLSPDNKQLCQLKEIYNIAGVFDLGTPYLIPQENMFLIHLVSYKISSIDFSIYTGPSYSHRLIRPDSYIFEMPQTYCREYTDYIHKLEGWLNTGLFPDFDEYNKYEFMTLMNDEVDSNYLCPRFYTEEGLKVRAFFEKESDNFDLLSNVADIMMPHSNPNIRKFAKRIETDDFKYPLDIDSIGKSRPTTVVLQPGDILLHESGMRRPYLYKYDGDEVIYAPLHAFVIRPTKALPEYLYLYLNSRVAEDIFHTIAHGSMRKRILQRELDKIPVLRQKKSDEEYVNAFNIRIHPEEKNYSNYKTLNLENIDKDRKEEKDLEDILNVEIAEDIKVFSGNQVREFLENDFTELNNCYDVKAYKAAVIMAGSILEAVLIDWLSEIDGTNHFDDDNNTDSLCDCINEIKQKKKPKWNKQASEAHDIRKARNMVHVKKSLESSGNVTEEICRKTVEELKDIMDSRCE